jgi:hypothetical protein
MKKLLILISAACLLLPAMAFGAGNANPTLYLEIAADDAMCICIGPPLQCYRYGQSSDFSKNPWQPTYVYVHVGKVENGFLGVPFGMVNSGNAVFASCTACPGFLKGPSTAGEPAAVIVSSTGACHQWMEHPVYCMWQAQADVNVPDIFTLVASADLGHHNVINCDNEYDVGTVLGHGAEWAPQQTLVCGGDPTAVELTTWGAIKGLYR